MHKAIRHTCAGDVGSPVDPVGKRFTVVVPAPGRSAEAGAVGSGAGAGALPGGVAGAGSAAEGGVVPGGATGWAVAAVFSCRLVVVVAGAVRGTAAVVLCCPPVAVGGRVLGCRESGVSGCSDAESVAAVPGVGAVTGSGGEAACVWLLEGLVVGNAATVSPPPTRATAVAATARRLFFFQRSSCRRRAARPCPVEAVPSWPLDEPVPDASAVVSLDAPLPAGAAWDRGVPGRGSGAGTSSAPQVCPVVAGEGTALWRRWAGGAMSGAYAPHPGHTSAPLRFRRHE